MLSQSELTCNELGTPDESVIKRIGSEKVCCSDEKHPDLSSVSKVLYTGTSICAIVTFQKEDPIPETRSSR